MKKLGTIHTFEGELKLSPLFIETTVSILAGFFLFLWGFIFFSNDLYQLSLFTRLRNSLFSEKRIEKYMENIHVISVDAASKLYHEERNIGESKKNITDYYYIAHALEEVSRFAADNPKKRVVTGLDYAFLSSIEENSLQILIDTLQKIPANLFIVFGSTLYKSQNTITTLQLDFIKKKIIYPATPTLLGVSEQTSKEIYEREANYFIGNIHYFTGAVRSQGSGEDYLAAVGYFPISSTSNKDFYALPVVMFAAGGIMEKDPSEQGKFDFGSSILEGSSYFTDAEAKERFTKQTGKSISQLREMTYYNFFTPKDIKDLPNHFNLSDISRDLGAEAPSIPEDHFSDEPGTEYFFITNENMEKYIQKSGDQTDYIFSPASIRNPFTKRLEPVSGVMTHITALSNLKHQFYIDKNGKNPKTLTIFFTIIVSLLIFYVSWTGQYIKRSLLITVSLLAGFILFSFLLFAFYGIFITLKAVLVLGLIGFASSAIIRFIYTTSRNDRYEMVAARVLTADHLDKLIRNAEGKKPKIVDHAVVLVLFPRKFPDIGNLPEEAKRYTAIYNKYLELVLRTLDKYGGNRNLLSLDGIMGFWNVPFPSEDCIRDSFNCAKELVGLIPDWQSYIDKQYGGTAAPRENKYTAVFDICLNVCRCYTGAVGFGRTQSYTLSGEELNKTILSVLKMREDYVSTLFLTDDYYDLAKEEKVIDPEEFTERKEEYFTFFKYHLKETVNGK